MNASDASAGAVWECQLDFRDGTGKRKKYVILLNTCVAPEEYFVAAVTTSNANRYRKMGSKQCGSPEVPCYRIDIGQVTCFPVKTFIQFDNTDRLKPTKLQEMVVAGNAKYLLNLPQDRLFSVMNCALKSDDIEGDMLALIKKTLKSLEEARKKALESAKQPAFALTPGVANRLTPNFVRSELVRCGKTPEDFCALLGIPIQEFDKRINGPFDPDIQVALDICKEK